MSAGRFMLFDMACYYPSGGAEDLAGRFATLEEAMSAKLQPGDRWQHIYDIETGKIVAERDATHGSANSAWMSRA